MMNPPAWLQVVATVSLVLAGISGVVVLGDILAGHRQKMGIMNLVWPLTTVWSGPLGLIAYYRIGRARSEQRDATAPKPELPFWQQVALGSTHCGSGCALGDVLAEGLLAFVPVTFLGSEVFGTWMVDFLFAFLLGIIFQFFTIAPMRGLGWKAGLLAAVQADTASLIAWQIGMYGGMAIALFGVFSPASLPKSGPVFWFMMQLAMCAGFLTSYPVNWWLLRRGIKEAM